MKTQPIRTPKIVFRLVIVSLLFGLTLSACQSYDSRPQKLADALGATHNNTLANFRFKHNLTDRSQYVYFEASSEVTNEIVEQAVKSIDSSATIRPGAILSYAGSWSDRLTTHWSEADPQNLRVITGKDMFRDSVQYKSWYVNWSATQNPKSADVYVRFVEYSSIKVALEMAGHSITSPIIIIESDQ